MVILMLTTTIGFAQKMNRQKIKLLKITFITEAINLTPQEAEKFWPIYNLHSNKMQQAKRALNENLISEIRLAGGIENITETKAQKLIDKTLFLEQQITDTKIKMIQELSNVISAKKIIKLQKTERDFNRRLLQEFGKRRRLLQGR